MRAITYQTYKLKIHNLILVRVHILILALMPFTGVLINHDFKTLIVVNMLATLSLIMHDLKAGLQVPRISGMIGNFSLAGDGKDQVM